MSISLTFETCLLCKCGPPSSFEYSIVSFDTYLLDKEAIKSYMEGHNDASGENPMNAIREDFGIQIVFETLTLPIAKCKPVSFSLIQSAYACSCEDGMFYPKESIVSVQVFSNKSFGETYPTGSDVAEFFQVREWDGRTSYPWLSSFKNYFEHPADIANEGFFFNIYCFLTAKNIEGGEYEFTFVVKLSDDRVLEQSIKAVLE